MAKFDDKFNLKEWKWIAVHFPLSRRESMAKVAWLIYCKCTPEEISQRKIDPRIVIPLCTIVLLDEIDVLKLKDFNEEVDDNFAVLVEQELKKLAEEDDRWPTFLAAQEFKKFEKKDDYYSIFLAKLEIKQENVYRIKQKLINSGIDSINPSKKWQSLFKTLEVDLQLSLLYHLISYRLPNRDDWRNIFIDVKYELLAQLCFWVVISLMVFISLKESMEAGLFIEYFFPEPTDNSNDDLRLLYDYNILYDIHSNLDDIHNNSDDIHSNLYDILILYDLDNPVGITFCSVGIIVGLITKFSFLATIYSPLNIFNILMLNLGLLLFSPYLLLYLSWKKTLLIWAIISVVCSILWIYAKNRESKTTNPLKNILKSDSLGILINLAKRRNIAFPRIIR